MGALTRLGPGGETGFTVSQRDPRSGMIAVSWLSFDDSIPFYSGISQSTRDAVILARSDGAVLLVRPPDPALAGQLGADSIFMRWRRGELSMPATATSAEDDVARLWRIKEIEGHPVYALYGLDASLLRSGWLREVAPFGLLALFSSGALMFLTGRLQRSAAEAETARAEARTQREMAEISKRLELALRASSTGVWEWNPATDAITCSNELLDILGMTSFDGTGKAFRQLVHPDDINRVREATAEAVGKGKDFSYEFRIRAGDGGYRWIDNRGRATYDASGNPIRVLGTATDVTDRKEAEEKLLQSEARYRMLHESLRDAFVQVAMDGRILEFNDLYCQMLGYSPEEVRTLTYQELTPERWRAFEEGIIRDQVVPRGYSEVYEKEYRRKDGSIIAVELRAMLGRHASGELETMWALVRDITERKAAEARLAEREAQLALFVENAPASIAMFDPEMRYLAVSRRFLRDYGLPEEFEPHRPFSLRPVSGDPAALARHSRARSCWRGAFRRRRPLSRKDGSSDWVRWTMKPWLRAGGDIGGALLLTEVITDKVKARLALAESEERFRALADNISQFTWIADCTGWITWYNKRWYEFTGSRPEEMAGWGWTKFHHPDHVDRVVRRVSEAFRTGTDWEDTFPLRGKNGQYRWFLSRALPIRNEAGEVVRWFGTNTDVTDLRTAQENLRHQASLLDQSHDAILVWKIGGVISYWSKGAERLYGWTSAEAIGRSSHELLRTRASISMKEIEAEIAEKGQWHGELIHSARDGREIIVESYHVRVRYGGAEYALETNRDVTDRKKAEECLRASEEKFRGIYENAGTGIAITDLAGRFQSCNPAYSALLGYSEAELRALNFPDLVHPDDRETNMIDIRRLAADEIASFEIFNRYASKDGGIIWVHKHVSLLRDASGKPTSIIALVTDMTGRKRRADQIDLLLREVNHRAKNMLALVQAIARQTVAADPQNFIERFGERVRALSASQDLLVKTKWKGVNLADLVRSQLAHFKDAIDTRIELRGPPVFISASAAQTIGMALHELATNAGKYGALSAGEGRVGIAWNLERPDGSEDRFVMSWREHGGPPVKAPTVTGFGSTVISRMAKMSLDADVELTYPPEGLRWRLECPAGKILEPGVA